jgi:hypothetical protein
MNVSPDFSPPLRLIAPYFVIASLFYTVSMGMLFGLNPNMSIHDFRIIGWVHTYMIGFVMMVMVGAMGQLSVVIAEVHHRYRGVFGWIWPLLSVGTVILVAGFYAEPSWLMIGGGMIFVALGLFAINLFVTLTHGRRKTDVTRAMRWSNLFLLIGLGIGWAMALGYGGLIEIDPSRWVSAHLFSIFGGYVLLSIMGVSTVLLPMFGACKRPSDNEYRFSFYAMALSVGLALSASIVRQESVLNGAIAVAVSALGLYLWSVQRIFTSKQRHYADIWERSVAVAFIALILAVVSGMYGYFERDERFVMMGFWLLMAGFLGFLITAHLYKIVPFLVWFERFAPYLEEQNVPMLHELLPQKWANAQWILALLGVITCTAAIGLGNTVLLRIGALFMMVSGMILMGIVVKVLRYRLNDV